MSTPLLVTDDCGLYCPLGDFHIDPWRPVPRAVITHAHADHARWGSRHYLAPEEGAAVLRARLGNDIALQTLPWNAPYRVRDVEVSFHPAGHILGSAQVCVEYHGERWVVSGDYKAEPDPTCTAFEPVRCHTFVTESTFGLPIYHWQPQAQVMADVNAWWRQCQDDGAVAVLYAYALGKAQRLIGGVDASIGPIVLHGAVEGPTAAYRATGIALPPTRHWSQMAAEGPKPLVIAPPSADGTPWLRKFGEVRTAFASGWMQVRGARRRRAVDRGFVLSDHVDWPSLLAAIDATGAETVYVTHGYVPQVVRYLRDVGIGGRTLDARPLATHYEGESDLGFSDELAAANLPETGPEPPAAAAQ